MEVVAVVGSENSMPAIVDPAVGGVVMTVEAAVGFLVAVMAYYYLELEEPAADVESHFGHHGWSELVHQLSEVFADPAVLRYSLGELPFA